MTSIQAGLRGPLRGKVLEGHHLATSKPSAETQATSHVDFPGLPDSP